MLWTTFSYIFPKGTRICLLHLAYKKIHRQNCRLTYTYSFFMLGNEFHVVCMQAKYCQSCTPHEEDEQAWFYGIVSVMVRDWGGQSWIPGQFLWRSWCMEWQRDRFSCWMLWFCTIRIMLSVLPTHIHLHTTVIRQVSRQGLGPETKQCSFAYKGAFRDKSPKVAHCYDQWKMLWLGK
jgi:hypothetical protein